MKRGAGIPVFSRSPFAGFNQREHDALVCPGAGPPVERSRGICCYTGRVVHAVLGRRAPRPNREIRHNLSVDSALGHPRPDSSVVERGPEKAGVGGSIPSLATTFQTTCKSVSPRFHSNSFQLARRDSPRIEARADKLCFSALAACPLPRRSPAHDYIPSVDDVQ